MNKAIRKKVFDFYVTHKELCDHNYELAEDKCIDELYEDVADECTKKILLAKTSIIILTANKYERNILHKKYHEMKSEKICRMDIELSTACQRFKRLYAYWFKWENYSILHIHTNVTGSNTIGGSSDVMRWVLSNPYLFPRIVISFGICFGTKESNSELGDVIISRKIYPYFVGVKVDGQNFNVVDDNSFAVNDVLFNKITNLVNNNKFNDLDFKVNFKNYITGEAVVSSASFRKKIIDITTQEVFAGDMESYGLFKECISYPYNIPCIVIKSICDWGIEKNFDPKDIKILSEFKETLSDYFAKNVSDKELKEKISSLKDRIQAYSAGCAFDVLNVFIRNKVMDISVLEIIRNWIRNFQGAATSCKEIRGVILENIKNLNIGLTVTDQYTHICIKILEDEGLIKCDRDCNIDFCKNNACPVQNNNVSIDILRWR